MAERATRLPWIARFFLDTIDRADNQLVAGWYHTISVSTERERARMRFEGLPFVDPTLDRHPSLGELELAARRVVDRAVSNAGMLSGAASIAGAASVPPEVAASIVATVRLAQRLCIVYGFDPGADRGQMALCRALAAAYEVDLPASGPVSMRVSDLPRLARPGADPQSLAGKLARALMIRSVLYVAGSLMRMLPVVNVASGAVAARRRTEHCAARMRSVLERLSEVPGSLQLKVEDAVEV